MQEADEEDEEGDAGDDEELAAEDEELLAAAADLLPALTASMGPDGYAPVFLAMHAQPLLSRLRPQQPIALRAVAAGAAAEVVEALGPRVAQLVPAMLPLLLRELQTEVRTCAGRSTRLVRAWLAAAALHAVTAAHAHALLPACLAMHACICTTPGRHQPPERGLLCWPAGGGESAGCGAPHGRAADGAAQHVSARRVTWSPRQRGRRGRPHHVRAAWRAAAGAGAASVPWRAAAAGACKGRWRTCMRASVHGGVQQRGRCLAQQASGSAAV